MVNIVQAEDLTKVYVASSGEEVVALGSLSMLVESGESLAVIGPSGCGKSTLLHLLALLESPTSGELSILGAQSTDLTESDVVDLRRSALRFIPQRVILFERLSVLENVLFGRHYLEPEGADLDTAAEVIGQLGLQGRATHRVSKLSGGERQRVCVARALVGQPRLILADEPTSNLDSDSAKSVLNALIGFTYNFGTGLVIASHDPLVKGSMSRVLPMRDGIAAR